MGRGGARACWCRAGATLAPVGASGPRELRVCRFDCGLQEEYSDFQTLEARLQDVARRLVHRPGAQPGAPTSSSAGTPSFVPNGVIDSGSVPPQQPAALQLPGQQAGQQTLANSQQMMLSAQYPGAQGMQGVPGMIPTPNTTAGDGTELLPIKPEQQAGSTAAGSLPAAEGATAADSNLARGGVAAAGGMIPVSGAATSSAMGTSLMSNGMPVLIKEENRPSPSMYPVGWPAVVVVLGGRRGRLHDVHGWCSCCSSWAADTRARLRAQLSAGGCQAGCPGVVACRHRG